MARVLLITYFSTLIIVAILGYVPLQNMLAQQSPVSFVEGNSTFPNSEGFGTDATGGRDGTIYHISSINEMIDCFEGTGRRVCLFTTGGKYTLKNEVTIRDGNLTIIGQTASGSGVVIEGSGKKEISLVNIDAPNVGIQYVTLLARSTGEGSRALSISNRNLDDGVHDIVISHVTTGLSEDENTIVWYNSHDVTIEYSLDTVALLPDGKGPLLGRVNFDGGNYSYHHNINAHIRQRMPRIRTDRVVDVSYNYITAFLNDNGPSKVSEGSPVNYIGNFAEGSEIPYYISIDDNSPVYVDNSNLLRHDDGKEFRGDQVVASQDRDALIASEHIAPVIKQNTFTGDNLKRFLLSFAGNSHAVNCRGEWYARRTPFDTSVIAAIREGVHIETDDPHIFSGPVDPGTPCEDSDNDGLPDEFERRVGSDIKPWDIGPTGWSWLETYANGLLEETAPGTPTNTPTPRVTGTIEPTPTPTPTPPLFPPDFLLKWVQGQINLWEALLMWLESSGT